nr:MULTISPECIES: efflux RND transporter permease subunit [Brasilonema]
MMTTVTTILGLFPLALGIGEGSEFLQPLGIVVFFGMANACGTLRERHNANTISHPLFLHSAARCTGWEMGKAGVR